jgi:hypothetical protein
MWRLAVFSLSLPLVLITFAAGLTTLAGTRLTYPSEYPDPFAPYEALMAGQLAASENQFCDREQSTFSQIVYCITYPVEGPFDSVSASVHNGMFKFTSFRANHLYVGDVIAHWGQPDSVSRLSHQSFYLTWSDQERFGIIDPVGPRGQFSYMLPVEYFAVGQDP